jgi:DNA-binding NtrC family response regulator
VRSAGSMRESPVDVRIIAATGCIPADAVAQRRLSPELYHRLRSSVIVVPPLRERREDIPLLVDHFIALFNHRFGGAVPGISPTALQAMMDYSWPGNAGELAGVIQEACMFGNARVILLEDLPSTIAKSTGQTADVGGEFQSMAPRSDQ